MRMNGLMNRTVLRWRPLDAVVVLAITLLFSVGFGTAAVQGSTSNNDIEVTYRWRLLDSSQTNLFEPIENVLLDYGITLNQYDAGSPAAVIEVELVPGLQLVSPVVRAVKEPGFLSGKRVVGDFTDFQRIDSDGNLSGGVPGSIKVELRGRGTSTLQRGAQDWEDASDYKGHPLLIQQQNDRGEFIYRITLGSSIETLQPGTAYVSEIIPKEGSADGRVLKQRLYVFIILKEGFSFTVEPNAIDIQATQATGFYEALNGGEPQPVTVSLTGVRFPWQVTVSTEDWMMSGSNDYVFPKEQVRIKSPLNSNSQFQPLLDGDGNGYVFQGNGTATQPGSFTEDFFFGIDNDWVYRAGSYQGVIVFTLSAR